MKFETPWPEVYTQKPPARMFIFSLMTSWYLFQIHFLIILKNKYKIIFIKPEAFRLRSRYGVVVSGRLCDLFSGVVSPFCLLFGSETRNIYNRTNFKEKFIKAQ